MKEDSLHSLWQEIFQIKSLENRINSLYEQRSRQERQVSSLRAQYRQEQEEAQRLEKRNLGNYLLRMTGKWEEKQVKEQQEARGAAQKLAEAERELEGTGQEIREVQYRLAQLRIAEAKYQELLDEKRRFLRDSDTEEGRKIRQLEQETKLLEKKKAELQEALGVGNRARGTAMRILSRLESADSWNTLDMLGGRGLSHVAKHAELDDAQAMLQDLRADLSKFQSELSDVEIIARMQVNVDGFLRFSDWFFDGIFSELAVRDRIDESWTSVQYAKEQISQALKKLETMKSGVEQEIQQRKRLLEELLTVE